jgi:hypothetical protein
MRHPIEIFRSGRHTAMSGEAVSFSDTDLDAIASSYDPAVHEAPIVIGHPTDNAPAFGWVKDLARKGETLEAGAEQLDPAFAEAVKAGRYKKVSASFYKPDSASNPKPGQFYLRHVGFLGAMPPSVKGLKEASFAGSAEDCLVLDFAADGTDDVAAIQEAMDMGTPLGRLRAWLVKMFGQENADEALPVDSLGGAAADAGATAGAGAADAGATNLAEPDPTKLADAAFAALELPWTDAEAADAKKKIAAVLEKELAAATAAGAPAAGAGGKPAPADAGTANLAEHPALSAREKALEQRELEVRKREQQQRQDGFAAFVEGVLRDGRPLPCPRATVIALLTALDAVPRGAVSFGEGEQRSAVDIFQHDVLARLPKQVEFTELAGGSFVESEDPQVVAKAAQEFQAAQREKGIHISTTQAVNHVKGIR